MNGKRTGFTFFETIIVLGITALILTVTIPSFTRSRQVMAEERFWRLFRREWRQAQLRAEVSQQLTVIRYNKVGETMYFRWSDGCNEIVIPATLRVRSFSEVVISPTGYTRARTQVFQSAINHHLFLMKIQLAWGGYRVEEKDAGSIYDG
ncbi:type II secretion system protein [Limosilactobacillus sp. STM2_1]|uniref:Type II secretion system protein n=1 Tax=Limosilactobacillus rudii TaxID=2759755 RepID=A0A7W3ULQ5_9LACO|nr:type II secretion system protein [Limosilactobacillus rudii]MBB1079840.1 type II secretion system protein [Limosilactobacillus rudii]MBB1097918.1 type II secretion system protein [Limosilactobacillus rudii]MCD7134987.1 type II secretion system GspH family protein [Limosilactobacillus rudii]